MTPPASFLRVKNEVKAITGCTNVESTTITMMLQAKNAIDNGSSSAMEVLLALIIRKYGIHMVSDVDDLTKLLNTSGQEYDSLRIFMNGIKEDEV